MKTKYLNYEKFPYVKVNGTAYSGFEEIRKVLHDWSG